MEAFNIADELKQWAEAKDWVFLLGDQFHANIEATEDYDVSDEQFRQIDAGQPVLWCNLEANETRAIGNRVSAINYTGLLGLGIKKDADYSIEEDAKTNANLDETFKQKYDRRLKELLQLFSNEMKMFACANNLQILDSSYVYDINKFDTNIDFVIGTFDIEQESFTIVPNEVDLTLTAETGGSVEPYEGAQAQNKYSNVPINAVPDTNYAFKEWIIDGVKVLDKLTNVFMNRAKSAIAYFESTMQVIQEVFGTAPVNQQFIDQVGSNDVTYKNVQVGDIRVGAYIEAGVSLSGVNSFDISHEVIKQTGNICGWSQTVANDNRVQLQWFANNQMYIALANGQNSFAFAGTILPSTKDNLRVLYNGLGVTNSDKLKLFINEIEITLQFTGNMPSQLGVLSGNLNIGRYTQTAYGEYLACSFLYDNVLEYNFQDGDDDECYDISGNGNHGQVIGAILSDFRGTRIDGIDSVLINNGYTLFQQIADPTKYITAAYDINGLPTLASKVGYNKIAEIPPNVVSDNKITYDGVQGSISGVDNTYDELNALGLPEYDVTKTANYISNLKVNA